MNTELHKPIAIKRISYASLYQLYDEPEDFEDYIEIDNPKIKDKPKKIQKCTDLYVPQTIYMNKLNILNNYIFKKVSISE